MTIEEALISEIRKAVIDDVLDRYVHFVHESSPSQINNDEWRRLISVLQQNDATDTVSSVFRQVMVDVLANVLGILDGSSNLETMRGTFRLMYDDNLLEQNLSDTFWEFEQHGGAD